MYRYEWRRPGCLLILVFGVVAVMITSVVVRVITGVTDGPIDAHWTFLLAIPVFAGVWRLYILITRRKVPLCPHCGVATNVQFPVCRACGRVKY